MSTPYKCSGCARTYPARIAVCQVCGGTCAPASPADLKLGHLAAETEPAAVAPGCPCCGEAPGSHTIAQQTRHLTEVSFIPGKRTYLVTTVKVPGVCAACHRSLQVKRFFPMPSRRCRCQCCGPCSWLRKAKYFSP
ncbi:MAG: hypothetical protein EXS38_10090 [Opitutus sp.]|nr:hypothetical protein [Opitutus sp.]